MQKQSWMKLKDLTPAASNSINATVILVEKGNNIEEGKEKTKTCVALVADETACVNFQMWGDECEAFQPGDIICISKGIFSRHKNKLLLRAGKSGSVEKVVEFTMLFVESPNMSEMRYICPMPISLLSLSLNHNSPNPSEFSSSLLCCTMKITCFFTMKLVLQ
ncbi:SOSS complex subunit B1 [Rhynchospora pubera]|uniref:SOSS complex subunit B1 n=1 Tax=Rhynchospora pubera TaxID=906938 RepID=A0AAV8ESL8_9POAL|nr:SOSS complex subunit B1 [Rhynchospora pubera]